MRPTLGKPRDLEGPHSAPPSSRFAFRPPASSVAGQGSSFEHEVERESWELTRQRQWHYIQALLRRYLWLPGTPARTSRHDRRLAKTLFARGIPLCIVEAALLLATVRRTFRSKDALPLPPIRSMCYFLPVVDEVLHDPTQQDLEYVRYLEGKLTPLAEAKVRSMQSG